VLYLRKHDGLLSAAGLPYGSVISKGQLPPTFDKGDSVLTGYPATD